MALVPSDQERIVRRFVEMFNSAASVDEIMSEFEPLIDPELEFVNPPDALEGGTRRGLDEFRGVLENVRAGLGAAASLEILELKLMGGGNRVFSRVKAQARGDASGVEVGGPPFGAVWTFRDGRVLRYEWSWDPDELLARFEGDKP